MQTDPLDCALPILSPEEYEAMDAAQAAEFRRLEMEWEAKQMQIKVAAESVAADASGQGVNLLTNKTNGEIITHGHA